jgi:hypothetical protein
MHLVGTTARIVHPVIAKHPVALISSIDPHPPDVPELPLNVFAATAFITQHQLFKYHEPAHIHAKTTHSTTLAVQKKARKPRPHPYPVPEIPRGVQRTSLGTSYHQHQPWDHAIDLKPDAAMKKCGIYRLTTAEMDALKIYIADHLRKGYIRPSKSPSVAAAMAPFQL